MIAEDEVVYKLGPEVEMAETETEDLSDTAVPKPPPVSSLQKFGNPPHHHQKPGPAGKSLGRTSTYRHSSFQKPPSSASGMS